MEEGERMKDKLFDASMEFIRVCDEKLTEEEEKGKIGWDNPDLKDNFKGYIRETSGKCKLKQKDLVNMANYCMFLWNLIQVEKQ